MKIKCLGYFLNKGKWLLKRFQGKILPGDRTEGQFHIHYRRDMHVHLSRDRYRQGAARQRLVQPIETVRQIWIFRRRLAQATAIRT